MRPGQLITAVTCSAWGLCFGALLILRHLNHLEVGRITTN